LRHGLAGAGETDSRSSQRYATLRWLSSWTDQMSIFFETVRSAYYVDFAEDKNGR
jgi:hypothetical protein